LLARVGELPPANLPSCSSQVTAEPDLHGRSASVPAGVVPTSACPGVAGARCCSRPRNPTGLGVAGRDEVLVGRIRRTPRTIAASSSGSSATSYARTRPRTRCRRRSCLPRAGCCARRGQPEVPARARVTLPACGSASRPRCSPSSAIRSCSRGCRTSRSSSLPSAGSVGPSRPRSCCSSRACAMRPSSSSSTARSTSSTAAPRKTCGSRGWTAARSSGTSPCSPASRRSRPASPSSRPA
jgi:hypothetical protein